MSTRPGLPGGCPSPRPYPRRVTEKRISDYNCPMELPAGVLTSKYTYAGTSYAKKVTPLYSKPYQFMECGTDN